MFAMLDLLVRVQYFDKAMERLNRDNPRDIEERILRLKAQEIRFMELIEVSPEDDLHLQSLRVCRGRIEEYESRLKQSKDDIEIDGL
jgi:hypothetical protein